MSSHVWGGLLSLQPDRWIVRAPSESSGCAGCTANHPRSVLDQIVQGALHIVCYTTGTRPLPGGQFPSEDHDEYQKCILTLALRYDTRCSSALHHQSYKTAGPKYFRVYHGENMAAGTFVPLPGTEPGSNMSETHRRRNPWTLGESILRAAAARQPPLCARRHAPAPKRLEARLGRGLNMGAPQDWWDDRGVRSHPASNGRSWDEPTQLGEW